MKKTLLALTLFTSLNAETITENKKGSIVTKQQKVTLPKKQEQKAELKSIGEIPQKKRQESFESITSEDMFAIALKKDPIVIVKFVADWAPRSKDATIDNKILDKYHNMVSFYTYPFIEKSMMALKWAVNGVPFYVGFKKGNHVRSKGHMDEQDFEDFIVAIRSEPEPVDAKAQTKK